MNKICIFIIAINKKFYYKCFVGSYKKGCHEKNTEVHWWKHFFMINFIPNKVFLYVNKWLIIFNRDFAWYIYIFFYFLNNYPECPKAMMILTPSAFSLRASPRTLSTSSRKRTCQRVSVMFFCSTIVLHLKANIII